MPGTENHFRVPLGISDLDQAEYRDVNSTAMVYRYVPVTDHFRVVDEDTVLGISTLSWMPETHVFFYLERQAKLR